MGSVRGQDPFRTRRVATTLNSLNKPEQNPTGGNVGDRETSLSRQDSAVPNSSHGQTLVEGTREFLRYEDLLGQIPAAMGILLGPEHRWSYVNELYVQMTGRRSANDFLGKTVIESLPEIAGQGFIELLDGVYRTGEPYAGREVKAVLNRFMTDGVGDTYWDFTYQPMRSPEGRVEGILVHAMDVTDRVAARKAIEQSEERFRAIVDTTPECVKVVAADGTLLYMNSAGLAMLGAGPIDAAAARNVYDLIAPEDRERYRAFNEHVCRGSKAVLRFDMIGLQGVRRHMESHAQSMCNANGSIVQLAVVRDISARKQAEEAQRRLAAIVESSDDAIVSKDLNGIVTSWNKSAERLFGYTAEEMVGKSIKLVIPPELHTDEDLILGKIRRGEKIDHFETVRLTKAGERLEVSLTISPVKDEEGKVVGAAKIARNITLNKKLERTLRTTEKLAAAGRLAATVAHEINNPLEAVMNLVYLAQRDLPKIDKVAVHLNAAKRELDRVAHIARQTLGFYRDTSSPATVNVAQTMDDLLYLYEKRLQTRRIKVVRQHDGELEVTAFVGEIRQAFSNLISNSVDAMPQGGMLLIRISKSRAWSTGSPGIRVTVLDTGPGIAPPDRKKIFEPFFTTKADVGTGLGLWITRNIVVKHRGSIRVRSRTGPEAHGTAFSIFLPAEGSLPEESHPAKASQILA
jgi:PAS domain S-box-containing protein